MMATARELVWSGIGPEGSDAERRNRFFQRFHGLPVVSRMGRIPTPTIPEVWNGEAGRR